MKDVLQLIKHQPHDHQALLEGIRILKKRARMLDVVTLYIKSPFGAHHNTFFIKHENENDDAYECEKAFSKIMSDHLNSIAHSTLKAMEK